MREVVGHWADWKRRGLREPLLLLDPPTTPIADLSTQEWWHEQRQQIMQRLADVGLERGESPMRGWLDRGLYGLSALALQFEDVPFWVTMFENVRPWPLVYLGIGCDLTIVRRELEDDLNAVLRRRFSQRLLSADTSDEWTAVVQVFYFYFRCGQSLLLEDVECLRAFWERTKARDVAARQVYLCLRLTLERFGHNVDVPDLLRDPVESMLRHAPRRIRQWCLVPQPLHEVLSDLCRTVTTCELTREAAYREDWVRLLSWLDTHDMQTRRLRVEMSPSGTPHDDGTADREESPA